MPRSKNKKKTTSNLITRNTSTGFLCAMERDYSQQYMCLRICRRLIHFSWRGRLTQLGLMELIVIERSWRGQKILRRLVTYLCFRMCVADICQRDNSLR